MNWSCTFLLCYFLLTVKKPLGAKGAILVEYGVKLFARLRHRQGPYPRHKKQQTGQA